MVSVGPEELNRLLRRHGFALPQPKAELLARFHALLIDRNRTLNLTRIWNLEDMVVKHYVDCLIVARFVRDMPSPLLDIGTGAGFPGIPLKILLPDLHVILGEGVRKRVDFLRDVRAELKLEKLDIIGRNIDREFEYPVRAAITRAVEPIADTLKRITSCLVPGGLAIFMKGPNVDEEKIFAAGKLAAQFEEVADHGYVLPATDYRRRLLIYRRLPCQTEPQ